MAVFDYNTAHVLVQNNKNFFWDGWKLIFWKEDNEAIYKTNGLRHNGSWGISETFVVSEDGKWRIPDKYVKHIR
ncbi:MAG: hypothetical protein RLZZ196_1946 [Bacteroidota bacterium]